MASSYPVPAGEARSEILVQNSRFIASLAPAFSVEEARNFVAKIRNEYSDASHHVPAFLIGCGASVTAHCSDDGEPSGTAGRPVLTVLQGSGFGDVVLVVTRYFGGTKLGTGGLVRAYTEAAKQVLAVTRRAQRVLAHTCMLVLPYGLYQRTKLLISKQGGEILGESFAEQVTVEYRFRIDLLENFDLALSELSNGKLRSEIIETGEIILPFVE